MRYFIISDVHSFYDEMIEALNKAGFDKDNPEHWLISCGDSLDRGSKPLETIRYLNSLPRKTLVRGNHEDLLEEIIYRKRPFAMHDYSNGTMDTISYISGIELNRYTMDTAFIECRINSDLREYLSRLVDYEEIGDYIFCHGWIPFDYQNASKSEWEEARWLNGMNEWSCHYSRPSNKTIVCGHWSTSWGHKYLHNEDTYESFDIFYDDGIYAIDGCTAYSKQVNVLVLDIDE